jgi:hypothetical protein
VWTDDVPQSFKSVVVESVKELVKEIETIKEHVADQAMEHVHANEVRRRAARRSWGIRCCCNRNISDEGNGGRRR